MYTLKVLSDKVDSLFRKIRGLSLPSQTGNVGKILITDGTGLSWGTPTPGGGVRDSIPTDGSTNSVESNGVFDALALKVDKVTGKQLSTEDYTTSEKTKLSGLATVATSGSYNDLSSKPTIPAATTDASQLTSGTLSDTRLSTTVTKQGNTFNGNSQLVKTDSSGRLPALNGSLLTNLPSTSNVSTAFQSIAYIATLSIPFDSTQPNIIITSVSGNLNLSVTGTTNGDSGLIDVPLTAGTEVLTLGNGILRTTGSFPSGTGAVISLTYINENGTLAWYCNNPIVSSSSSSSVQIQKFTASGTWTKPTNAKWVEVQLIGAGGGGGSGRKGAASTVVNAGGAGGGGGYSISRFDASLLGSTEAVTVPSGGAGGASRTTNSTDGANGAGPIPTSFGNWLKANGGSGGFGGTNSTSNGGTGSSGLTSSGGNGTGGSTTGGNGSVGGTSNYSASGGASGGGITTGNVAGTGAIGGGAATFYNGTLTGGIANGGNGNANPLGLGGTGGGGGNASTTGNATAGGNGGLYGAGGGGGGAATDSIGNSGAGGNGANGVAIIITHF